MARSHPELPVITAIRAITTRTRGQVSARAWRQGPGARLGNTRRGSHCGSWHGASPRSENWNLCPVRGPTLQDAHPKDVKPHHRAASAARSHRGRGPETSHVSTDGWTDRWTDGWRGRGSAQDSGMRHKKEENLAACDTTDAPGVRDPGDRRLTKTDARGPHCYVGPKTPEPVEAEHRPV